MLEGEKGLPAADDRAMESWAWSSAMAASACFFFLSVLVEGCEFASEREREIVRLRQQAARAR